MRIPRTTNLQPPTANLQFRARRSPLRRWAFDVGCSLFAVFQRSGWAGLALFPFTSAAEPANPAPLTPPLPDVGLSLVRVFGALALVLAIFLGGVWLFRNWQRLVIQGGRAPRLNVLEVRSLGGRHVLYVVGYQQSIFSQGTLGYSAAAAGFIGVPGALLLILLSSRVGAVAGRFGPLGQGADGARGAGRPSRAGHDP